ncbi:hypothetical protein [Salinisphaera hydrothermalis]|uniref:Uncharacterized protein n=1 Tax=Salinisphaera hydrothermalis (strain C41B8) TaxID=1304275 RepID=A0A084IMK9_SALHC|nr:hypothetical protein [Salinisphaera hydrothermalis]KEZ77943.1 hypothetical protein C41B8_07847 [Salinisphaera hydrothermalis C41B8]
MQTSQRDKPDAPRPMAARNDGHTWGELGAAIGRLAQQVEQSDRAPEVIHNLYCALQNMLAAHCQEMGDANDKELACCYARLQLMMAGRAFPALDDLPDT